VSNATRHCKKLKARQNYETKIKGDLIEMMKAIQEHTLPYQEHCYDTKIIIDELRNLLTTRQQDDEDLVGFTRRFKAARGFYNAQVGIKMKLEKMAKANDKWDETDAGVTGQVED
jgi:hypothetical protein